MESVRVENLSFTYPKSDKKALDNICLTIQKGEFVTVCGKSGCGKTTLLRLLKSVLSPAGELCGKIYFNGEELGKIDESIQAEKIGFVMQECQRQIVTDMVWHELAFGLENFGFSTTEIRARVSEMASFFGIDSWFHKKTRELSGGQKQILNLASIMVTQPSLLILDEPTSQLDPIAAQEFLNTLEKINRELGTTIILSEHRLDAAFPISDRVIVMDEGKIIACAPPEKVGKFLINEKPSLFEFLPTPVKIYTLTENGEDCPISVREGRVWLEKFAKENTLFPERIPKTKKSDNQTIKIELKDVWFRYEKNSPDIIKGMNIKIKKGEIFSIVGGNGSGKTTFLSLISKINTPQRGEILIDGKSLEKTNKLYEKIIGFLPQNPETVFVKNTVEEDFLEMLPLGMSDEEREERVLKIAALFGIENLLFSHPFDLSGGEKQKAALCKILLKNPEILILDEPTKGMDASFKEEFADVLAELKKDGITVIMVSHDIEFCAKIADCCALMFDGNFTSTGDAREFFGGKYFYTTAANRMARNIIPKAVHSDDVVLALGGDTPKREKRKSVVTPKNEEIRKTEDKKKKNRYNPVKIVLGVIFTALFLCMMLMQFKGIDLIGISKLPIDSNLFQIISTIVAFFALLFLLPDKKLEIENRGLQSKKRLEKRTKLSILSVLFLIPLTLFVGIYYFEDRKFYFISLIMILEVIIPFCISFEGRSPNAKEMAVISVLCGITVAGRAAFSMLPQFKPILALLIISGICFGGETGFLIGAVSVFVSNLFFGQGPWTPWQMFSLGMVGFVSGILYKFGIIKKTRLSLSIYGFLVTLIVYGGIMNPASVIMWQENITFEMIILSYVMGFPFDLVLAVSTAFFLWFISEPMIEKLERIKIKYGILDR